MDITIVKEGDLRYVLNNSRLASVLVPVNANHRRLEQARPNGTLIPILDTQWSDCFAPEIVEFFRELWKEKGSGVEGFYFAISTQAPLTVKFSTFNKRTLDKIKDYFKRNYR